MRAGEEGLGEGVVCGGRHGAWVGGSGVGGVEDSLSLSLSLGLFFFLWCAGGARERAGLEDCVCWSVGLGRCGLGVGELLGERVILDWVSGRGGVRPSHHSTRVDMCGLVMSCISLYTKLH